MSSTWSGLTTDYRTKSMWGKFDKLGIDVDMVNETIPLPRDKDVYIMECFIELGI